jgi:hypothetical protein
MSDAVKRWTPVSGMIFCVEGGDYVMAEDYERLRADMKIIDANNDELRAEVERLKARVITDEQVDRAWKRRDGYALGGYAWAWYGAALIDLGIVECQGCGGSGIKDVPRGQVTMACPRCHGHGWIREERGDE